MADRLITISIIAFILAGVFVLLAVLFSIKFNIPKILGELTGHTAKKTIARRRRENEQNREKVSNVPSKEVTRLLNEGVDKKQEVEEIHTERLEDATCLLDQQPKAAPFSIIDEVILVNTSERIV